MNLPSVVKVPLSRQGQDKTSLLEPGCRQEHHNEFDNHDSIDCLPKKTKSDNSFLLNTDLRELNDRLAIERQATSYD